MVVLYQCSGRRNTRSHWLGVDFKLIPRDTLQWVLRAAGKRWEGRRDELEQRLHEYVLVLGRGARGACQVPILLFTNMCVCVWQLRVRVPDHYGKSGGRAA